MKLPNSILVPTDFSEPATEALDYAIELSLKLGARITLLHAYEIPMIGFPDGALVATADIAGHILNSAQAALNDAIAARKARGVELTPVLKCGEPRGTILAVAKEVGADLVVMGTHGRRGLAHMLMGSVAEHVVRVSPLPVLTVRARAASDKQAKK
jgi:nucleotide-binding universal stress UspA family protein